MSWPAVWNTVKAEVETEVRRDLALLARAALLEPVAQPAVRTPQLTLAAVGDFGRVTAPTGLRLPASPSNGATPGPVEE
jgi:hypothetical protein